MSKVVPVVLMLIVAVQVMAKTPVETLIGKYEDNKGFKCMEVSGSKMMLARPILKKYPIGPMSDVVERIVILKMEKASAHDRALFLDDMKRTLKEYIYCGKSAGPAGTVDVYVHQKTPITVDEVVSFNPESFVINALMGEFPVKDLEKIEVHK